MQQALCLLSHRVLEHIPTKVNSTERSILCSIDKSKIKSMIVEIQIGSASTSSAASSAAGILSAQGANSCGSLEGTGAGSGEASTAGMLAASAPVETLLSAQTAEKQILGRSVLPTEHAMRRKTSSVQKMVFLSIPFISIFAGYNVFY